MDYINAGHERPIIIKKDKIIELETKSNFVLAGLNNFNYQMERVNLDKDDTILFYTDGLSEAIDDNFNQFGKENIIKSLKEEVSLEHLKTNLKEFSKENQFDDETALLLKLKNVLSINIKNPKIENIDGVIEESRKYLSFLDSKTISQICIILDELLSNSIKYGIKDVADSFINFVLSYDDKKINIDLIDNGIKFNPFGVIKRTESDEIGGRGLLVVDKLSSNRKYEYVNKKNHIHVEKIYE
jgi:anti-sigma regulatory factor (Ser/Thr protein kinase)